MNWLIIIKGIRKMYDFVNVKFHFNTNGGRGVESGSIQIRKGADLGGYVWPRGTESVHLVFANKEFPHGRSIVGRNGILTHGQGQQNDKFVINFSFDPN